MHFHHPFELSESYFAHGSSKHRHDVGALHAHPAKGASAPGSMTTLTWSEAPPVQSRSRPVRREEDAGPFVGDRAQQTPTLPPDYSQATHLGGFEGSWKEDLLFFD